ncbi:hypothetical protein [Bhargavaea cecembensis]|uniref:hypothetical protein n=1 Tax=Bhargavaea cecembensis TaxID=394098 RepID=UPI00058FAED8|nr:hypothetical protein [Bhargavaea cecembensis]
MLAAERMMEAGLVVLSLAAGTGAAALLTGGKGFMGQAASVLADFVIFLWVGKIVLNIGLFVRDPVSVLAYPAGSSAFYVSAALTAVSARFRWRREPPPAGFFAFLLRALFLSAFFFEFAGYFPDRHGAALPNLLLYGVLSAVSVAVPLREIRFVRWAALLWGAGVAVVAMASPLVTLFGFVLSPWFVLLVCFAIVSFTLIKSKEGIS